MDNELHKATDQVYNHLTRGIKRSYIYIGYLNYKNDERNDIIVGIQEDYKTIEEYIDHARRLIAKINSVDIDYIIVEDYKLFGPFLQFLSI